MRKEVVIGLLVLVQFLVLGACRKTEHSPVMRGLDWEDVRTVPNNFGGTVDFVLVPESRQRDKNYYKQVSEVVCGQRTHCTVDFWTDRKHIPESAWIKVEDLAVMTASYERSPSDHVKSCTPKVVSEKPIAKPKTVQVRKGDKATGYSPIIAFEILESGDVMNAHVRRTSGIADVDAYALNSIQGTQYNERFGCGTVETEANVLIHFQ